MFLKTIKLGFKAFDPHELLCHFLAEYEGWYRDAGLRVELTDITFTSDAELGPETFQTSCGAALLAGLTGVPQRVVFVAVDRPMFWLYARPGIETVDAVRNSVIASYPPVAPPWHFTRIFLGQHQVDPDNEVTLVPARDDAARLGLLRSGNADAAVLSSALAPERVERLGFRRLACLGDNLRLPTTGLATHAETLDSNPDLVKAMINVHLRCLHHLHANTSAAEALLQRIFDVDTACAADTMALYRQCFTHHGRVDIEQSRFAIALMEHALGHETTCDPWKIYDFSFIEAR